ncbi:MAG: hypothetical protein ABIE84_07200 [bacterium]
MKTNKTFKEIRILERILTDSSAPREKRMLAMIGLVHMAKRGNMA